MQTSLSPAIPAHSLRHHGMKRVSRIPEASVSPSTAPGTRYIRSGRPADRKGPAQPRKCRRTVRRRTPIAKLRLDSVSPWPLAGLLYLGSGLRSGRGLFRLIRRSPRVRILRSEILPLAGAVGLGGILGPVLLMFGVLEWRPPSREPSRWWSDSLVTG